MDSAPAKNQSEAFYSQLRPRDREQEIVGPLKLKVHSSLERVVNELDYRRSIDPLLISQYRDKIQASRLQRQHHQEVMRLDRTRNSIGDKNRSKTVMNLGGHSRRQSSQLEKSTEAASSIEKIQIDVLRPLEVTRQSQHFKRSIFPELHQEKQYFKAAQTMLINDIPLRSPCKYKKHHDEVKF